MADHHVVRLDAHLLAAGVSRRPARSGRRRENGWVILSGVAARSSRRRGRRRCAPEASGRVRLGCRRRCRRCWSPRSRGRRRHDRVGARALRLGKAGTLHDAGPFRSALAEPPRPAMSHAIGGGGPASVRRNISAASTPTSLRHRDSLDPRPASGTSARNLFMRSVPPMGFRAYRRRRTHRDRDVQARAAPRVRGGGGASGGDITHRAVRSGPIPPMGKSRRGGSRLVEAGPTVVVPGARASAASNAAESRSAAPWRFVQWSVDSGALARALAEGDAEGRHSDGPPPYEVAQ